MQTARAPADLVVTNAKIYTMDKSSPWATALAIRGDKFLEVGTSEQALATVGPTTKVVDAQGRLVLPGLIDCHTHAFEGARADLFEVRLSGTDDLGAIVAAAKKANATLAPGRWLKGAGWRLGSHFDTFSTGAAMQALDAATGDRPTILRDSSHHAALVNSAALRLAGITEQMPDPENGHIVKNAAGALAGLLLERAINLVDNVVPVPAQEEMIGTARHAAKIFNSFGLTGFVHALTSETTMRMFKLLDDRGELNVWVATFISTNGMMGSERDGPPEAVIARRANYRAPHVATDCVKYFMDGVPGARTAAFREPYEKTETGEAVLRRSFYTVQELRDLIAPLDAEGIHVKVHAVGDQAIRDCIDAIEAVRELNGADGAQHSIAHLGYIFDEDVPRMKQNNILADLCPPFWFPHPVLYANMEAIGRDRGHKSWPVRDLVRAGTDVVIGTDWPIIPSPNPWPGMAGLITRKDPFGRLPGTFRPEQALTLEEALPLYTINVATSMGFGQKTGSIAAGKSADFITVDRDLFSIPPEEIAGTRVLQTYFSGRLVYEA